MKKNPIILLLLLISCGPVFSQNSSANSSLNSKSAKIEQKNAVFIDLFPLMEGVWEGKAGAGLFYERQISNYFSIVGEANFYTDFKDETAYSFMGHGRVYPLKTSIGKLFADAGFGYRSSSLIETVIEDVKCLEISASAGWKFIIGNGFIIEPSVGYRQNIHTFSGQESHKGGMTINVGFGWAF
ncbi:hypothetical protein HCH04_15110 [Bacteroides thetaiotaomicron]|uniref:hypothetical protein n=1 Tax=Bacteroides thetaiotaomicron TaxID=818 RepID=UPI001C8BAEBC|nr:hypothetical protein [Bacteroides thetaiotaomicron]MBX9049641.1 hypothetical protein [Bacteroides thetaiotaomicron]MBX9072933.1 hypothetical protein [Bacteroides thetaiotaomicron]